MFLLKRNFLLLLALVVSGAALLAQTEAQIESDQVKRVGSHLNCQCGACNENLNCMMSAGQCHFCKPARTQIYKMQTAGTDDAQIIRQFIMEYGEKIFRPDPNSYFWLIPYIGLALGGVLLVFVLKRMRGGHGPLKPIAAGGPSLDGSSLDNDATYARYRDAIEKDTSRLD